MPIPIREARLGALDIALERRSDGTMVVRSTVPLPGHPARLTDRLEHWARVAPDRTFLARREHGGAWRHVGYGEAWAQVRGIAAGLLARGLSPERPIVLLSGNGIEHALLTLAAMTIGVPAAPISPAYSLISSDFGKLRHIVTRLEPQLVFTEDAGRYARAIAACCGPDIEVVATRGTATSHRTTMFAALAATPATATVGRAHAAVGPETVAKILFTSGSTGMPKGVTNTQRMLTANQAMLRYWLPFVADEPPVLLDWLPWSHTFGGNHNLGLVLYNGGTLYIDDGRPTPQLFGETLRNLAEVSPTLYFNVPQGYEQLVTAMRGDDALRRRFFARLQLMFYAAAGLPRHTAEALDDLAAASLGHRLLMVNGFGSTETGPAALASTRDTAWRGSIGLPLPGVALKFVPGGEKLEIRIASPSVMPGYWRDPAQTAKAFDEEGYYRLGDAFRFADPADATQGFHFDGRLTEDFKLASGTWVSVGPLRARVVAGFAPLVKDVVIAGHDRGEVGGLVFPDLEACRALLADGGRGLDDATVLASAPVRAAFGALLLAMAADGSGASMRLARLILLDELPSIDANEITDKGSINQRAVLARRAGLVQELYAAVPTERVVVL